MFINFSNHPSYNWSQEQLDAAGEYGEIIDLPFPQVPSEYDERSILMLADEQIKRMPSISAGDSAIMIQGEFTLTYALVSRLKGLGYKVLSACADRKAEEVSADDGSTTKVSRYVFTRFREYEA